MPGVVRRVVPEDLDDITGIENRCFHGEAAYPEQQLEYLAFRANSSCLVAENEGVIMGFIIILYRHRTRVAGVETLDVDPAFRGLGVGRMLLEAAEKEMLERGIKRARLEVSEGNVSAVNLYKQVGYIVAERLVDYYIYSHNGTRDALRMIKGISQESQP